MSYVSDGCDFGGVLGGIRSRDRVVDGDVSVSAPLAEARVWRELCPEAALIETDNNQNARIAPQWIVRSDPSMPPSAGWGRSHCLQGRILREKEILWMKY